MESPLEWVKERANEDWLIGYSSPKLAHLSAQKLAELSTWQAPPKILLIERDPLHFLASVIAASSVPSALFLANPDWGAIEQQQVMTLVQPDLVWGEGEGKRQKAEGKRQKAEGKRQKAEGSIFNASLSTIHPPPFPTIHIPTGGSSGEIRFSTHTWETLMTAVAGFRQYFEVDRVNSCCVLPLYHVSGLMQFLRSFTSGGKLALLPFKTFATGNLPDIDPAEFFLSLVPTQLQRLLSQPSPLSHFHTILLGGAPAWSDLLETARRQAIRLAPTYGMTETASQIATLKPDDFLAGKAGCGRVLPHAQVKICSPTGEVLSPGQVGIVTIQTTSLALGYYPHTFDRPCFQPDDLGYLDATGYLYIVGRQSDKIITGGENVFPAEVEAAIQATGLVQDVCVVGVDDRHWGQIVAALYVPTPPKSSLTNLQASLANNLSKFKQPKLWVAVANLPRNAQGKINRQQVQTWLAQSSPPATAAVQPTRAGVGEPSD
jgi:O-succinylbenzoic acid--CoA ligase